MAVPLVFRDAVWLNRERARAYALLLVIAFVLLVLAGIVTKEFFFNGERVRAGDFLAFWSASVLALGGEPLAAYDAARHAAMGAAAIGGPGAESLPWLSPPHFLLLLMPFSLLPYPWAWALWSALTAIPFALACRAVLPVRGAWIIGLATPGAMLCMAVGQTGLLTSALAATTLVAMERRPVLAGMALGLLTLKPQFGLLFPVFLAFGGRWVAFAAATVTFLLLTGLAAWAFGPAIWPAFAESLPRSAALLLRDGATGFGKLHSAYGVVRAQGGGDVAGWIAQGLVMAGAALATLRLWRRSGPPEARNAATMACCLLGTPYVYVFEMAFVTLGVMFLAAGGLRRGFLPWERMGLVAAALLPWLFFVVGSVAGLAAALLLLGLALRRAAAEGR